jgi:DNA invertase Pin-like site-specific DNA recombinase
MVCAAPAPRFRFKRSVISEGNSGSVGRPRADVDEAEVLALRKSGASWRAIAKKLGVGLGTVHRSAQPRSKKVCGDFSNGSPEVLYA